MEPTARVITDQREMTPSTDFRAGQRGQRVGPHLRLLDSLSLLATDPLPGTEGVQNGPMVLDLLTLMLAIHGLAPGIRVDLTAVDALISHGVDSLVMHTAVAELARHD